MGQDVAQAVEHSLVKVGIILHGGSILAVWAIFLSNQWSTTGVLPCLWESASGHGAGDLVSQRGGGAVL